MSFCEISCGAPEGSGEATQSVSWEWSLCSPTLKEAFVKLRSDWSKMLQDFIRDNQAALPGSHAPTQQPLAPVPPPTEVFISACQGEWKAIIGGQEFTGSAPGNENRMVLLAAIQVLRQVKGKVSITCASVYIRTVLTQNKLRFWRHNGWKTLSGLPVVNGDLWRQLSLERIEWRFIKGEPKATTHRPHKEKIPKVKPPAKPGYKVCLACGEEKPLQEFKRIKGKYFSSPCKQCRALTEWRKRPHASPHLYKPRNTPRPKESQSNGKLYTLH